ncbi:MAG: two-component system, OmpR family, response regulator [Actinomycetota bacterium]|nr:two-component system, OmpR family, response regulator [Actinomycetota bacterium]
MNVASSVALVRWPEERELRLALRNRRVPRLLIVASGVTPPMDLDELEDWAAPTAAADELEARMSLLAARADGAVPAIDDADVLRVGDRWVALGPIEAKIARLLVANVGTVVARGDVERAAWGDARVRANTIDRVMHRLRSHVSTVGLALATIRSRGYVLEARASARRVTPGSDLRQVGA